ncbi:DEAD/DEAH box helicase [Catenulispora subtropica]|uniref:DEAD/DEAH box helicase domain protein n=1 Tax=Catenulispora subtropica TaxID=450798 RepID=A0ABN2RAQ7_9ACTN
MNPLELAERLRADYRRFTWTTYPVADQSLRGQLERLVEQDALLWRGPFLSVQPRFELDGSLKELADKAGLPAEIARAFPQVERLFVHQAQAIERIARGESTLVATGTGSGKTESFLIPVIAHAYQARHRPGVKAIAIYPMNALVNDQEDRVKQACDALGLRYGVYTGGTPQHLREHMQNNPPDVLLTNYSMLEYLLTRREDRKLFGDGVLRHLVLDEIHTYQGALGSEIACLVRRLRGHVDADGDLVCIGLSATVSAGGDHAAGLARTAQFATSLFATPFDTDSIVEETPVITPSPDLARLGPAPDSAVLRDALARGGDPDELRALLGDPQDSALVDLLRSRLAAPRRIDELVQMVAELPQRSGVEPQAIEDEVAAWLLLGAGSHTPAGPPVLEAKVHLFLRSMPRLTRCTGDGEHLWANGATECAHDGCGATTTFSLGVCLGCGQDYDLERDDPDGPVLRYVARRLHTDPVFEPDAKDRSWFPALRCVSCGKDGNGAQCMACGSAMREVFVALPEVGRELTRCKVCGYMRAAGAVEEFTQRTAAAVTATAFSLHTGLAAQSDDVSLRRLLVFADSRQDTAFQAGYIRSRARAAQVRRLIVEVVRDRAQQGADPASFDTLVEEVFRRGQESELYDSPAGSDARRRVLRVCEWDVLGEIASDERRPPTLDRLGLITVGYPGLEQLDDAHLTPLEDVVGPDIPAARWLLGRILDFARTRRAVGHELLRARLDAKTEADLLEAGATVRIGAPVVGLSNAVTAPNGTDLLKLSSRSSIGAMAKIAFPNLINQPDIERAIQVAVALLERHGLLQGVTAGAGKSSTRLLQVIPQAMEIRPASPTLHRCLACRAVQPGPSPRNACVTFNCKGKLQPWSGDADDYERQLADSREPLQVKAEEHSGQVPLEIREGIEERFKNSELNLLVCTMTLELGVDLGQLLAVVLRNVPPRASNYAQRAGRAGRREERVALVVTFAGTMPHDSYYYQRPVEMIRGSIRPPAFLPDNPRVITRHARALALELCGEDLPQWMRDLVSPDTESAGELINIEPVRDALAADAVSIAQRIHASFRLGLADDDMPWLDATWCHRVVAEFIADLDAAVTPYKIRQQTLEEELRQASATISKPESRQAIIGIGASLDAMRFADRNRAYVLSYLSSVGFLPSYAFPTETTSLFLEREAAELAHDSVRALKDYAPGQVVYARGAKWAVDEIDLRRSNLVNADGVGGLPSRNICLRCDTVNDATSASCLSCDSTELSPQITIPMRALRAEKRTRITSDEEARSRRPFEISHHLGAPKTAETWLFERPGLVMQWERNAALTVLNRGRIVRGALAGSPPEQFAVCTACGMWFDMPPGTTKPTQAQRKRLERHDKRCSNHDVRYSMLMTERKVDCLQLLPDLEAFGVVPANLQEFLASIRAALDLGCRIVLQSGDNEVAGFDWPRPDPNGSDALLRLAVLYEEVPGGAGYLRQLGERFGEVAAALVPVLDDCDCEKSCYACLRSYGNQLETDLLNRHVAADFLRTFIGASDVEGARVPAFADGFIGLPRSPIERRLAIALIDAHAPRGHAQYPWGDRGSQDGNPHPITIADFAWPDRKVAVFCDGWAHHSSPEQQAGDKRKRDAMRADGWTVLAFWGGEIVRDPRKCAEQIIAHLHPTSSS